MVQAKSDPNSKQENIVNGPNWTVKQNFSLGKFLFDFLVKHDDKICQIDTLTNTRYTFNDVKRKSVNLAMELQARNIGVGDVISICSAQTTESILPVLSGFFVGATINPLDPSLNKYDVKHILNIVRPKIAFIQHTCLSIFEEVIQELELTETKLIVLDENCEENLNKNSFHYFLRDKVGNSEFRPINFTNSNEHIAVYMSSSGTTGLPKIVALSDEAIIMQIQVILMAKLPDNMLNMSSLFWITGLLATMVPICLGIVRFLTPPFDAEHVLHAIEKYKAVWMSVGVTYFSEILTHQKASEYDLSSMHLLTISGAKLSDYHLGISAKLFKNCRMTFAYGLTEMSGCCFQAFGESKPNSIGYLLPGLQAKIIDAVSGGALGPNEKGELVLKGKLMFSYYHKNPKATAEAIDSEGWFHTGDLCYYDEDNCFFIDGRLKEQFKCRGWQISPFEMESLLLQHSEILEAVVIGVPHKVDVARAKAFIVRKPHSSVTKEDIHNFMRERMNPNKQLTGGIVFVESLPKTVNGKVKKNLLLELHTNNEE